MSPVPEPAPTGYLLLFRNGGIESHQHLSPDEQRALAKKWNDWYDGLAMKGQVQHGQPLGLGGRVVTGPRGDRVTDGPFAEAKEVVAGYVFLSVIDLDEATRIARGCPGLAVGLTVEVRPVLARSPVLPDVQGHAPDTPPEP